MGNIKENKKLPLLPSFGRTHFPNPRLLLVIIIILGHQIEIIKQKLDRVDNKTRINRLELFVRQLKVRKADFF